MVLARHRLLLFLGFAVLANVAISLLLRHAQSAAVTAGACADLLITIPAAYYLLVVRAGVQPLITVVPVLLSGLLRATYVLPDLGATNIAVAVLCELGIAWFVMRRGGNSFPARIFLSELSILRMAFAGWLMKPDVPAGARAFSMHKENGAATLFGFLAAISFGEAVGMHFVIQRWSPVAAWWITGLSLYGSVLLIALARSFVLRPIVVTETSVLLRAGLLWSVEVARENIVAANRLTEIPDRSAPGNLRIVGIGDPNITVELREAVTAEGLYGRRKLVRRIGVAADRPGGLLEALGTGGPG